MLGARKQVPICLNVGLSPLLGACIEPNIARVIAELERVNRSY